MTHCRRAVTSLRNPGVRKSGFVVKHQHGGLTTLHFLWSQHSHSSLTSQALSVRIPGSVGTSGSCGFRNLWCNDVFLCFSRAKWKQAESRILSPVPTVTGEHPRDIPQSPRVLPYLLTRDKSPADFQNVLCHAGYLSSLTGNKQPPQGLASREVEGTGSHQGLLGTTRPC